MSVKGLLFDLDGVIVDSMPLHTVAWREYLSRHGFGDEGIEDRMHGKRNDEIVALFWGDAISAEENFRHGAEKEALFRDLMAPVLEHHLVPGVREFLARNKAMPMGLATNAEPANAEFVLTGAGLKPYFKAVVDGMQVKRPKPFPDVYERAAMLMGLDPVDCVVFEDSPTGVAAGKAAGARVIGIATHTDQLDGVEFTVADFRDPKLHDWLAAASIR